MNNGIEVEVIWLDQNVVEFPFSSSNGRFSGHAEIYVSHDKLSDVAEGLSGLAFAIATVLNVLLFAAHRLHMHREHIAGYSFLFATP